MSEEQRVQVDIRPWSADDLSLEERLMGDPDMTVHLGEPESPEKIRERHERYLHGSETSRMFVIVAGAEQIPAGSIGFWEREWQGEKVWETGCSVLPDFQGRCIATKATMLIIEKVRATSRHRFLHAYPSVDNPPSNGICRKAGFTLLGEHEFEHPPGHFMRCNDWQLDLFKDSRGI